jgi:hypothetical protein
MPDRSPTIPPPLARAPMTGRFPDYPQTAGQDPAGWLRAIAAGLSAAGFTARPDDPQLIRAVTVTTRQPGGRDADIILDEDGYAELRWWPGPDATPAQVTDIIARALTIILAPPGSPQRMALP